MDARFRKFLADFLCTDDESAITSATDLVGDFRLDSLDRLDLFWRVENEFGVRIGDEETTGLRTAGECWNLIAAKLARS